VVLRLLKHKFVPPFVALADVTLGVIYTYRLFFLLFLVEFTEVRKHGVFLGLSVGFLLLRLHFLVLFNSRLFGIGIFELFRVLVLLFLDIFSGSNSKLSGKLLQFLFCLQLNALCDVFTIESFQLWDSPNDVVLVPRPVCAGVTRQVELLNVRDLF